MKITKICEDHAVRIVLEGEIDECGAEEVKTVFREVALTAPQTVAVDFAAVTHIGSAGIGRLLVFYKDLAIHGARLSLVRVPPPLFHLFREMRLDTIFAMMESTPPPE